MSSTIYNKAFSLELSHEFYESARAFLVNDQIELLTTSATSALISNGRMRMVRTGKGLDVFYKAYTDSSSPVPVVKPLIELEGPLEFVFAVRIKSTDAQFLNTTNLNQGGNYQSGNIFFLNASIPPVAPPPPTTPVEIDLTPSLVTQLRPTVFTYSFLPSPSTTNTLSVEVKNEANILVFPAITTSVNPETGIYNVQLNFSDQPIGIYSITAKDGVTTVHTASIYVDSGLASQNIFGIIRIKYTDADYFYQGLPDTISYLFEKRFVKWRYYAAIKSVPAAFFTTRYLEIIDDNNPNPPVYTFTGLDAGVPSSTIKIKGWDTVIITSNQLIPFTEKAIARFVLRQVSSGPAYKILMSALPNATVDGVDSNNVGVPGEQYAEIFLFIDQLSA